MEGNDIEDLGGGSFRTDRGRPALQPPRSVRHGPAPASRRCRRSSTSRARPTSRPTGPRRTRRRVGVTFNGTRRDVLIQDIVAVNGPRVPSAADSPKVHRQAFIYLVTAGRSQDAGQVDKVDRIRRQWETFFLQATDNRMRADTRLRCSNSAHRERCIPGRRCAVELHDFARRALSAGASLVSSNAGLAHGLRPCRAASFVRRRCRCGAGIVGLDAPDHDTRAAPRRCRPPVRGARRCAGTRVVSAGTFVRISR